MAPTHTATKGLGGRTLHSAFCFDHNMNRTGKYNFSTIDTFIFDEQSMCGSIFYREMMIIKRMYPDKQFICAGDFTQIPPVKEEHINFEKTDAFISIFENIIELEVVKGNTKSLADAKKQVDTIKAINRGEIVTHLFHCAEEWTKIHGAYTNKKTQEINAKSMFLFKHGNYLRLKVVPNDKISDQMAKYAQDIILYEGLPLRSRQTLKASKVYRGDQFIVQSFTDKSVTLLKNDANFTCRNPSENEVIEINLCKNFYYYFNPNYCMTIHNFQCQRFAEPYTLWETKKYTKNLMNVAVGRARCMDYIKLGDDWDCEYNDFGDEEVDYSDMYSDEYNEQFHSKCKQPLTGRESYLEKAIRHSLEMNPLVISFQVEKKFDDCRDKVPLRFDFRVNKSFLIEADGKQHEEAVEFFGGQEAFELQKKHDKIKTEYCKTHGIPLLRIPHTKIDQIDTILENFMRKL